jgi:hypothetical protein
VKLAANNWKKVGVYILEMWERILCYLIYFFIWPMGLILKFLGLASF